VAKVVPFTRILEVGNRGKDVVALQRALKASGDRKVRPTGYYGKSTANQLKKFQKRRNLPVTGIYDKHTHKKLAWRYDAYGVWLLQKTKVVDPREKKIKEMLMLATFLYNNRAFIHYTQSSMRMYGVKNRIRIPSVTKYEDCSSSVTYIFWYADAPDPNGLGFNGYGFTGTMTQNGTRVLGPWKEIDCHYYGPSDSRITHVTMNIGKNKVFSHGSEEGPLILGVQYRPDLRQTRRYF
jgi:peptidoglycan hydrolase-like protein with peptidoglycan-binding domain